MLQKESEEKFL